jgi:hypothetical protein
MSCQVMPLVRAGPLGALSGRVGTGKEGTPQVHKGRRPGHDDPAGGRSAERGQRMRCTGPAFAAISSRRAIRCAIGGWVENRLAMPWLRNGLAIMRWAVLVS